MTAPRCTCPWQTTDRGETVRILDQLCPTHGMRDAAGKCKACGTPIVQTPETAASAAGFVVKP